MTIIQTVKSLARRWAFCAGNWTTRQVVRVVVVVVVDGEGGSGLGAE